MLDTITYFSTIRWIASSLRRKVTTKFEAHLSSSSLQLSFSLCPWLTKPWSQDHLQSWLAAAPAMDKSWSGLIHWAWAKQWIWYEQQDHLQITDKLVDNNKSASYIRARKGFAVKETNKYQYLASHEERDTAAKDHD